ncbi:MAG: NADH-quinone oxidoreductase subunit L [Acidobacteria bacterium]|nr:NADH-quinone oxidoreductase subunit L [Acidobacteriota bacterium]
MEPNLQLWLIPLLPLVGAAWNGIWGKRRSRPAVAAVAVGVVALSFLWSVRAFFALGETPHIETYFPWITASYFQAHFGLYLDPLSAVMALIVTGVGLLIHIYAVGYMWSEGGYYRFFSYMNLFLFFMLTLVLADNYLLLFVGWEGVGLCSYLLIGFYFRRPDAADAGKKAFIVTRLGDLGFLIGLLLLYWTFNSLDFGRVLTAAAEFPVESEVIGPLTLICLLLLMGASGKSAQVPLYVWLPDAMLGPTPVSALIHAATMVTAGVYIIARSAPLYVRAPDALLAVAVVGGITAFYAATIGIAQTDIKRILAYSTISQIGYMVMACGVAAFSAAVFHLMTHAFFKALLFLGAGSVMHALDGELDIRKMGGLRRHLPRTYWTFLAACLAIAALPPFSGFFSKDQILWQAYSSPFGSWSLWLLGVITAGITSFYMFRLFFLTFHGNPRWESPTGDSAGAEHGHSRHTPHESPPLMTWPLIVLAFLSVVGGWVALPFLWGGRDWNQFLEPAFRLAALPVESAPHHSASAELILLIISLLASVSGIALAFVFYLRRPEWPEAVASRFRRVHTLLVNKYFVDEMYRFLFVRPVVAGSTELLWKGVDMEAIDGTVHRAARRTRGLGNALRKMQSGNLRSYAAWVVIGTILLISFLVALA